MLIVNMKAQAITSNKYNFYMRSNIYMHVYIEYIYWYIYIYIKLYQQSFLAWIVQFLWKKDHIRQKALIR